MSSGCGNHIPFPVFVAVHNEDCARDVWAKGDVIHIGVGFDVVRFDKMGNVKASERGTDNR